MDLLDKENLWKIFNDFSITGVIHFAGYKAVNESIQNPISYYNNNITNVNFSNANLSNAVFTQPPNLSGGLRIGNIEFHWCDFTNANLEGTDGFSFYPNCIFKNTTMPDGTIRTDPEP